MAETPSNAAPLSGYFCRFPFEHAAIIASGEVFQCCAAFLPHAAGNVTEKSFDEVWNSEEAQKVRRTILDGSFTYCQAAKCPYLQGQVNLPTKESITDPELRRIIETGETVVPRGPKEVHLAYDATCNLACPYCRNDYIAFKGEELEKSRRIHNGVFPAAFRDATRLMISAQGDPFASKLYSSILQNFDRKQYPNLRIKLTTNGLLFNEEAWQGIAASHSAIDWIHVSVNAASAETFRINQKGGDWERMLRNLRFIASLRRKPVRDSPWMTKLFLRKTRFIALSFIIQQNNYREIPAFVALGNELDVDQVMFTPIFHADRTFSDREFARLPVHLPNHPEHQEFLRIMAHPSLSERVAYMVPNIEALRPEKLRAHWKTIAGRWPTGSASEWEAWYATLGMDAFKGKTMPQRLDFAPADGSVEILPQIGLDTFSALLGLDGPQVAQVRELIDDLKREIAEVFSRTPASGLQTPSEYLARLVVEGFEGQALDQMLKDYLGAEQESASGATYAAVMGRIELERRGEVFRLLRPGQRAQMKRVPIDSLLAVETGYEPFLEDVRARVSALQAPEPGLSALDEACARSGLDVEQVRRVRDIVNNHKDALAALFQLPGTDPTAPLEVLAGALAEDDPSAHERFVQHASSHRPSGQRGSYLAAAAEAETRAKIALRQVMTAPQLRALMPQLPRNLSDWPSGHDPLGAATAALMTRFEKSRTA